MKYFNISLRYFEYLVCCFFFNFSISIFSNFLTGFASFPHSLYLFFVFIFLFCILIYIFLNVPLCPLWRVLGDKEVVKKKKKVKSTLFLSEYCCWCLFRPQPLLLKIATSSVKSKSSGWWDGARFLCRSEMSARSNKGRDFSASEFCETC